MNSTEKSSQSSSSATESAASDDKMLDRVIKRFGGRHLIFRTQIRRWGILPRPYALVSTFRGPVWFFYGIGQVWVTHRKYRDFDGWMSRLPRIAAPKIAALLDELSDALTEFTHYCNEQGIEGTIVIESKVIEFHWTFGYELKREKSKMEKTDLLDAPFHKLVDAYLVAKEKVGL